MTWEALTWKEYTYRLSIKPVSLFITVILKNLGHVTSGLNLLEPFTAIFCTWLVYNHVHRKCVKPLSFWPVCNSELLWVCFGCLWQYLNCKVQSVPLHKTTMIRTVLAKLSSMYFCIYSCCSLIYKTVKFFNKHFDEVNCLLSLLSWVLCLVLLLVVQKLV